jgi:hypothetical protein
VSKLDDDIQRAAARLQMIPPELRQFLVQYEVLIQRQREALKAAEGALLYADTMQGVAMTAADFEARRERIAAALAKIDVVLGQASGGGTEG